MKPNIIVARHITKKHFFFLLSQSVHLLGKHSFPTLRYFLRVINAIFFCTHYIFKDRSDEDEKLFLYSSKCPLMTCLIKTFIELIC
jgi:hypothetical protein